MTYDANAAIELELERLRFKRQRYAERSNRNQEVTPAIKMIIAIGTSMSSACRRGKSQRATSSALFVRGEVR